MSPKDETELSIHTLGAEATRLLSVATEKPIRDILEMALRELDDAELVLNGPTFSDLATRLEAANLNVGLAAWQIKQMREAIEKHGPGVRMV